MLLSRNRRTIHLRYESIGGRSAPEPFGYRNDPFSASEQGVIQAKTLSDEYKATTRDAPARGFDTTPRRGNFLR